LRFAAFLASDIFMRTANVVPNEKTKRKHHQKEKTSIHFKMSHIGKVATVELIRELERRLKCSEVKNEK
jgi:hypothetical protein